MHAVIAIEAGALTNLYQECLTLGSIVASYLLKTNYLPVTRYSDLYIGSGDIGTFVVSVGTVDYINEFSLSNKAMNDEFTMGNVLTSLIEYNQKNIFKCDYRELKSNHRILLYE
ncbi:hypothetical protein PHYBLDRAFT_169265 [Phycomyces blakesleeanus NRRL 1555(-)]|uniref:Uncharacterized protein n=1 Tax=Phycomyces blakesleeanus (strain ATCC 8743b / DSM 1359 / FGSC 10004 / NBRC 33097 / NRRL 1555) TaxID=763407 RepID=A0A162NC84_PHYB8|nr:hypothetical protein PHYBLDRAFT_169265 [Phycomyces blakesleeanus NRRL 1555(-)]OAD73008.1 hypothetical protein PHYBLDRAFT_169265 [Phycomyces blakesleeanus NRRL 1555(-)]|eukprot:XP_018291048.1 hypothetical protein PHYBLDRAFT_169265 [Phycomyces blakesleeanus NRRL 1555(-)]